MSLNKIYLSVAVFVASLSAAVCSGCTGGEPTAPRPKGWPRITLPQHAYKLWESEFCPFTFEVPEYAVMSSQRTDSCVADFFFRRFECKFHLTYRHTGGDTSLWMDESEAYRKLVYNGHVAKVEQIQDLPLKQDNGEGTFYYLNGAVGIPAAFSFGNGEHFISVSFYFDTAMENDSLAPVVEFLREDMHHMLSTLKWK